MILIPHDVYERIFSASLDAKRLLHGRGKMYPGLEAINIDWYPPILVVTLFEENLEEIAKNLIQEIDKLVVVENIYIQKRWKKNEWEVWRGDLVPEHIIRENDFKFLAKYGTNQNIGLFLDMRLAREFIRKRAINKKVLNLFAYTCSFSVAALMGGAKEVINIDMNEKFLGWGRENHRLNNLDLRKVRFVAHDIMKSFGYLKKHAPYDLIIFDPPSFQRNSFIANKDYHKVVCKFGELLEKGGEVFTALNDPFLPFSFIKETFDLAAPFLTFQTQLYPPDEFKENANFALKMAHYIW